MEQKDPFYHRIKRKNKNKNKTKMWRDVTKTLQQGKDVT